LEIAVVYTRKHFGSALLRAFSGRYAHRAVVREIAERGGHLAEIAEFKGALTEPAARDDGDRVGCAAVDLDKRNQPLPVLAERIGEPQKIQPVERHPQPEDLSRAEVAVGPFGETFVFSEREERHGSPGSLHSTLKLPT